MVSAAPVRCPRRSPLMDASAAPPLPPRAHAAPAAVHRPRHTITSEWTVAVSAASTARDTVSLTQPRPAQTRSINIYTLAPGPATGPAPAAPCPRTPRAPVTLQPAPLKKSSQQQLLLLPDMVHVGAFQPQQLLPQSAPSFVCASCGRCRCAACADTNCASSSSSSSRRQQLPARRQLLQLVDRLSCVCCVRAVGYHCCSASTDSGSRRLDEPCSCGDGCGAATVARHAALAAASVLLPCLCCYWPLRGCLYGAELCFDRCCCWRRHSGGCRCSDRPPSQPRPLT